ncbi:MAG TPA: hypothetical protein VK977_00655, partial [Actinomycetota bacterium]|nr:hypothetical protein [Actinomycetota bacterium]
MTTTREPRARKPRPAKEPGAAPEEPREPMTLAEERAPTGEESRIPDPLGLEADVGVPRREFFGFDIVPPPDRPPQTEREREIYALGEGEMLMNMGP